ncbi:hypothetical protein ADUPG1_009096, partial [Aduncisulcus paluster]
SDSIATTREGDVMMRVAVPSRIAENLRLPPSRLPLLATLLSNDAVPSWCVAPLLASGKAKAAPVIEDDSLLDDHPESPHHSSSVLIIRDWLEKRHLEKESDILVEAARFCSKDVSVRCLMLKHVLEEGEKIKDVDIETISREIKDDRESGVSDQESLRALLAKQNQKTTGKDKKKGEEEGEITKEDHRPLVDTLQLLSIPHTYARLLAMFEESIELFKPIKPVPTVVRPLDFLLKHEDKKKAERREAIRVEKKKKISHPLPTPLIKAYTAGQLSVKLMEVAIKGHMWLEGNGGLDDYLTPIVSKEIPKDESSDVATPTVAPVFLSAPALLRDVRRVAYGILLDGNSSATVGEWTRVENDKVEMEEVTPIVSIEHLGEEGKPKVVIPINHGILKKSAEERLAVLAHVCGFTNETEVKRLRDCGEKLSLLAMCLRLCIIKGGLKQSDVEAIALHSISPPPATTIVSALSHKGINKDRAFFRVCGVWTRALEALLMLNDALLRPLEVSAETMSLIMNGQSLAYTLTNAGTHRSLFHKYSDVVYGTKSVLDGIGTRDDGFDQDDGFVTVKGKVDKRVQGDDDALENGRLVLRAAVLGTSEEKKVVIREKKHQRKRERKDKKEEKTDSRKSMFSFF